VVVRKPLTPTQELELELDLMTRELDLMTRELDLMTQELDLMTQELVHTPTQIQPLKR
jgi:hypothetical protein